MKIARITIKGTSGYCPADEAYEDKLTITESSISYEYKPYLMDGSETNVYKKWSYKTTSSRFREIFEHVAEMTPDIIHCDEDLFVCDIGSKKFIITYEDNSREVEVFFCPSEYFKEYFRAIKKLVPACETTPAVLWTSDEDSI